MMNEQQQPYMSIFIPYIANYTREDVRQIIERMNIGTISRIDISTRRNQPSNMAFVHFREWNHSNPLTEQVKYEMETYEQYSVDVPLDIKNPDLSPHNYFTLNLRINKNPIPPAVMTIESLSDGLMRTLDLVETLQKKCDELTAIGIQQKNTIENLRQHFMQNNDLVKRIYKVERTTDWLLEKELHQSVKQTTEFLAKPVLERQTNFCEATERGPPVRQTCETNIDDYSNISWDPSLVIMDEIDKYIEESIEDNQDENGNYFDPRIYGEGYCLHSHSD